MVAKASCAVVNGRLSTPNCTYFGDSFALGYLRAEIGGRLLRLQAFLCLQRF